MRTLARAFLPAAVLLIFNPQSASAQFRGLIEAGLNGSTLRGHSNSDFSPITRLSGGAGLIADLGPHLQFQPEVLYIVKGSQATGEPFGEGLEVEATFDLTYLELPLLLVYRFDTVRLRPRLFAGPTIAMKLDAVIRYRAVDGGPSQTEEDQSVRDRDAGVMFGAAIETDIGSETFMVGIRSSLGFSNARHNDPPLYNTTVGIFAAIIL